MDRPFKILIVEDELINQKVLQCILQKYGHDVYIANNGKEALDIFKTTRLDLIFMDILMPILDGITAIKEIRETASFINNNNIKIIATTSPDVFIENKEIFDKHNVTQLISKPIDFVILKQKLAEAISNFILPVRK